MIICPLNFIALLKKSMITRSIRRKEWRISNLILGFNELTKLCLSQFIRVPLWLNAQVAVDIIAES